MVAHLKPLRACGFERKPNDPLPFTLVAHIAGAESAQQGIADPVVSVHTLCDKSAGGPAARDAARDTHRRMLQLIIDPKVTLTGGRIVAVQYIEVVESPHWQYYSDTILRKCATYRIGLPYVAA